MSLTKVSYSMITGASLNVLDFGAVGNGLVDDTVAIQAAIDAATQYSSIYFPSGTYVISDELVIATNNLTLFGNAVIIAANGSQFESMIVVSSVNGTIIKDLTIDANQANRVSAQTTRYLGLSINGDNSTIQNVTSKNAFGFNSVPGVAFGVLGNRNTIIGCRAENCGGLSGTNAADGFYTGGGSQTILSNCIALNCTDTGFVLENSSYGLISNCTAIDCSAGAGVTAFAAFTYTGNVINGLTIKNWNAVNTGAIAIGVLTDNIDCVVYDTIVSNVVIYADIAAGKGTGSAIYVKSNGNGRCKQVSISNCLIDGASKYGVEIDADIVSVTGCRIKNIVEAGVNIFTGFEHYISSNFIQGGERGIAIGSTSSAVAQSNYCFSQTEWGIFVFDTATLFSIMNSVTNVGAVGLIGKDAGATINLVGQLGNALSVNNALGSATSGSIVNKFIVNDKNGVPLGYIPVYNI